MYDKSDFVVFRKECDVSKGFPEFAEVVDLKTNWTGVFKDKQECVDSKTWREKQPQIISGESFTHHSLVGCQFYFLALCLLKKYMRHLNLESFNYWFTIKFNIYKNSQSYCIASIDDGYLSIFFFKTSTCPMKSETCWPRHDKWNEKQRKQLLVHLLQRTTESEIFSIREWIMKRMPEPLWRVDPTSVLPKWLMLHIFSYLTTAELCVCSKVGKNIIWTNRNFLIFHHESVK